jgi:DNA mismatch repair protein MutL
VGCIRVLESWLADRIAAGEVVERPASVVKELVENALDAGARRVTVEFAGGGFDLVRVSDDGEGMDPEDAALCLRRFATSKLSSPEDLRRIRTLGFRGEALPSIAAVSQVEIVTCDGQAATRVRSEGGSEPRVEPASAPRGTVVTVRRLFFNTPARRAFLRSVAREAALCLDAVERHALGRPDVAFRAVRDGREVFSWPAEDPRERAARVLGVPAPELLPVEGEAGRCRVWGYLAPPSAARRSRSGQYFFVNARPVWSPLLSRAAEQGSRTLVFTGHYPTCALFLDVPPEAVDPNVHPRKLEVRFADDSRVFTVVERAVREAYRSRNLVRVAGGPAGEPASPGVWEVREAAQLEVLEPEERKRLPPLRLLGQVSGQLPRGGLPARAGAGGPTRGARAGAVREAPPGPRRPTCRCWRCPCRWSSLPRRPPRCRRPCPSSWSWGWSWSPLAATRSWYGPCPRWREGYPRRPWCGPAWTRACGRVWSPRAGGPWRSWASVVACRSAVRGRGRAVTRGDAGAVGRPRPL